MRRVVIVGRGGAGKSTLAARLAAATSLPVIELDEHFWRPGLVAMPPGQWSAIQRELTSKEAWIMDGDLGPYDVLDVRLKAADTVVVLDFTLVRCAWRALRRRPERGDFWRWLWRYRRISRPRLMRAIETHAPTASVYVLRSPRALRRFMAHVGRTADLTKRAPGNQDEHISPGNVNRCL